MSRRDRVLYLLGPEQVELRERVRPEPGLGELLLRVDAATTCGTDLKVFLRGGHPRMLEAPTPFGHEVAGTVVARGAGADGFREGERVVVANSASCGACGPCRAGRENLCADLEYLNGAFADHLLVPARFVVRSTLAVPEGLDPAVAAMTEPLACVHHGLEACGLPDGETVVLGGGPIGLMFVHELTACGHRVVLGDPVVERLRAGEGLGAAVAVPLDGSEGDAGRLVGATDGGRGAPLVVEATGSPRAWKTALDVVAVGGTVVLFGGCPEGTAVPCDTHRVHYSELTVKGVYHHRPATFASALARLAAVPGDFARLLADARPLGGVEGALRAMAERRILKAPILPSLG